MKTALEQDEASAYSGHENEEKITNETGVQISYLKYVLEDHFLTRLRS